MNTFHSIVHFTILFMNLFIAYFKQAIYGPGKAWYAHSRSKTQPGASNLRVMLVNNKIQVNKPMPIEIALKFLGP